MKVDLANALNEKTEGNDPDVVNDLKNNMITLRDITSLRVYVPNMPLSAINYKEEDNYRKTGIDPFSESIRELGKGIQNSGLQQPIGLIARDLSHDELKDFIHNSDETIAENWLIDIGVIFGNRRYLGMTNHTDLSHEGAYVYPKEAIPFIRAMQLIENRGREDADIIEEAEALYQLIKGSYGGNISSYARFSGETTSELSKSFKVGEAVVCHPDFADLVQEKKIADMVTLDYLARAITVDCTDYRKERIFSFFTEMKEYEGKLVKLRDKAKSLKDYSDGKKNNVPSLETEKPASTDVVESQKAPVVPVNNNQRRIVKNKSLIKKCESLLADLEYLENPNEEEVLNKLRGLSASVANFLSNN